MPTSWPAPSFLKQKFPQLLARRVKRPVASPLFSSRRKSRRLVTMTREKMPPESRKSLPYCCSTVWIPERKRAESKWDSAWGPMSQGEIHHAIYFWGKNEKQNGASLENNYRLNEGKAREALCAQFASSITMAIFDPNSRGEPFKKQVSSRGEAASKS